MEVFSGDADGPPGLTSLAYLTFVRRSRQPSAADPRLIVESDDERRREAEAQARRAERLRARHALEIAARSNPLSDGRSPETSGQAGAFFWFAIGAAAGRPLWLPPTGSRRIHGFRVSATEAWPDSRPAVRGYRLPVASSNTTFASGRVRSAPAACCFPGGASRRGHRPALRFADGVRAAGASDSMMVSQARLWLAGDLHVPSGFRRGGAVAKRRLDVHATSAICRPRPYLIVPTYAGTAVLADGDVHEDRRQLWCIHRDASVRRCWFDLRARCAGLVVATGALRALLTAAVQRFFMTLWP